jgi:methylmalonyl-CoA mutase N-terminal domain/subunit
MFSGFSTPEETNERWKMLFEEGQTGFSAALDILTTSGFDPDTPGMDTDIEVGTSGVPLYSIRGVEALVEGLPIEKISVALVTEVTATSISAMYFNVAKNRGIPLTQIAGTTQNDIGRMPLSLMVREPVSPDHQLKLACDLIEFCTAMKQVPKWNPINFTTYNCREGGINAIQEIAIGFSSAVDHIEELLQRGWHIDDFAQRMAFHLSADRNFFEEIAKYRAARRVWARLLTERYGAKDPRSIAMRYHVQTAGSSLTAQQPMVNIVRTAIQALEAVLGGCQSLHTNSYDEAICLPSEESVRIALRTQQVILEETGVTDTIDPLAGSYFVESLTNEMEKGILDYMGKIEAQGGFIKALLNGWLYNEMSKAFGDRQRAIVEGREKVVGVNCHVVKEERQVPFKTSPWAAETERERIRKLKEERDNSRIAVLRDQLLRDCENNNNVMPAVMDITAEGATVGEIAKIYREAWGIWNIPIAV